MKDSARFWCEMSRGFDVKFAQEYLIISDFIQFIQTFITLNDGMVRTKKHNGDWHSGILYTIYAHKFKDSKLYISIFNV